MARTFGTALAGRDNSLNAVRLVLAAAVILAHSWTIGGYGDTIFRWIGANSVNGFFALSGFLIAGSRLRHDFRHYITRRAQRIFPGFWVCLVVIAFVFAPIGALLSGVSWHPGEALGYIRNNASLVIFDRDIGQTLTTSPEGANWNRSLWSLMHEFIAYIVCGVLLGVLWVRRNLALAAGIVVAVLPLAYVAVPDLDGPAHMLNDSLRLLSFYFAGVLAYALRDRLRTSHALAGVAAVTVLTAGFTSETLLYAITPIPLTYLLLHIGSTWRTQLAAKEDASFGLYIYGYPVQQVLAMLGLGAIVPVWAFAIVSMALAFPLAIASWRLVEKPAMALRLVPTRVPEVSTAVPTPAPDGALAQREWDHHVPSTLLVGR
ncbi:acyltransferase family protein [Janibacter cremeus]|uniref:Peptidoglycan/LPS O-acetylase OafA/YrhL n=1 Tax=Janibacter cremeus TaxID=1285192 RepID=A0A852VQ03_9MICO|nr:acyltransferase [Janibacter cremeus]NYF97979.1 peptidoglycan/LPS O-acetylase OafA/YrhL [Janibacter cremeus]